MISTTFAEYAHERERQLELRNLLADVVTDHLGALSALAGRLEVQARTERDDEVRVVLQQSARQMRREWKTVSASVVLRLALARPS